MKRDETTSTTTTTSTEDMWMVEAGVERGVAD